jgi:hypothetical protein
MSIRHYLRNVAIIAALAIPGLFLPERSAKAGEPAAANGWIWCWDDTDCPDPEVTGECSDGTPIWADYHCSLHPIDQWGICLVRVTDCFEGSFN